MKYSVIYEKTATGFIAYVPDLPGCVATWSSLDAVKTTMREAIEFHLDGMRQDGTPYSRSLQTWRQRRWRYSFLKNCALLARHGHFTVRA
jgi:predicted RNase H-like HicB family nuclease